MLNININRANCALVVDDEVISLTVSAKMVEAQGWTVDTATNGDEALMKWQNNHYPLIITDRRMPKMDGFQLTRAIRQIEQSENIEQTIIIALTADSEEQEKHIYQHAGVNAVLTKPINQAKLKTMLTDYMAPAASAREQAILTDTARNSNNDLSPVDYAILEQIFPDSAKQIKILQDLQTHVHDIYHDLQHQIEQANIAGVESAAHRMKGSCRMVGVNSIAHICAEIEHEARTGHHTLDATISALSKSIHQFDTYLFNQTKQNTACSKVN